MLHIWEIYALLNVVLYIVVLHLINRTCMQHGMFKCTNNQLYTDTKPVGAQSSQNVTSIGGKALAARPMLIDA